MKTADFDYDLPKDRIAQHPAQPRDASRLMKLDRKTGSIEHYHTRDLPQLLRSGDMLVVNETRVAFARLIGNKADTGGKVELLLLRKDDKGRWECLARGRNLLPGVKILFEDNMEAIIEADLGGPERAVSFSSPLDDWLGQYGSLPFPPYIKQIPEDPEDYQTIYASQIGSSAAPTAGLHFTQPLLQSLADSGVGIIKIVLHIGLDTFAPVQVENPTEHPIHSEWCKVPVDAAAAIEATRANGGRVVAVGTTTVRSLETAALHAGGETAIAEFQGPTDLYILPGYKFQVVDAILTNFHLPRSTLIMMVSAFAGRKQILNAYEIAINSSYRFYSFGDAMLIL